MKIKISIVLYHSDIDLFLKTITSLQTSLNKAFDEKLLEKAYLCIIDNGQDKIDKSIVKNNIDNTKYLEWEIIYNKNNIGFGQGHNMAIKSHNELYHLILNPDVFIEENAITEAISFMQQNQEVGILTPKTFSSSGERQYLCKSYPAVFDLLIRGFAPKIVRKLFKKRLRQYKLQGITEDKIYKEISENESKNII